MKQAIREFWDYFLLRKADMERFKNVNDPVYDDVLRVLQRINAGLWFEFCTTPGVNELIISADGNKDLFPLVEEVVQAAPDTGDWEIVALKPKRGYPVSTTWKGVTVAIGEVLVVPVFKQTGEMGLRMYVPGLDASNSQDLHNALLRALDAGLGERHFAESIQATWVYPFADAPSHAFPLPELDDYRENRMQKG
jgi:hypothetical protein